MFPFSLRSKNSRLKSLPLGAFLLAGAAPARAQSAPQPQQNHLKTPQLTLETRPASAIADSLRPSIAPRIKRKSRALLIALPEVKNPKAGPATVLAPVSPAPVNSANAAPQLRQPTKNTAIQNTAIQNTAANSELKNANGATLSSGIAPTSKIVAARPVKVTTVSRFAVSRVTAQPAESKIEFKTPALPPTMTTVPPISPATNAVRTRGAKLASRGGLVKSAPIEVRSQVPETAAISDSQRRLLAKLDTDLGVAQKRLNRAETRLSAGQKQLGSFNDVLSSAMLDAGDDARGLHPFVRVAQRYMGTPYVWGGESARGFDCSGFIMRVMRDLGYRALPHSAAEQFRYGMPIAKPLLKAGDIVFFANTYKPGVSHVGIYLGRGRFIHAANSKDGTIVSGLNEPKWIRHYAGARRLLRAST